MKLKKRLNSIFNGDKYVLDLNLKKQTTIVVNSVQISSNCSSNELCNIRKFIKFWINR